MKTCRDPLLQEILIAELMGRRDPGFHSYGLIVRYILLPKLYDGQFSPGPAEFSGEPGSFPGPVPHTVTVQGQGAELLILIRNRATAFSFVGWVSEKQVENEVGCRNWRDRESIPCPVLIVLRYLLDTGWMSRVCSEEGEKQGTRFPSGQRFFLPTYRAPRKDRIVSASWLGMIGFIR